MFSRASKSSNRRMRRKQSRRISNVQRSPNTATVRATEHRSLPNSPQRIDIPYTPYCIMWVLQRDRAAGQPEIRARPLTAAMIDLPKRAIRSPSRVAADGSLAGAAASLKSLMSSYSVSHGILFNGLVRSSSVGRRRPRMQHARFGQPFDVAWRISEFGQQRCVVRTEKGRQPTNRGRRGAEPCRRPGLTHLAQHRIVVDLDDAIRPHLLVIQQLSAAEYRRARHVLGLQAREDL